MIDDPRTNVIVIRGSGSKAFCAGGDIKALHSAGQQVRAHEQCQLQQAVMIASDVE
jgi:enoyl-CoA hydratase/carnithine racemase